MHTNNEKRSIARKQEEKNVFSRAIMVLCRKKIEMQYNRAILLQRCG